MPHDIRRLAAAAALPGIPVAFLIATLLSPTDSTENATQLRAAAAHGVRWDVAAFFELLAAALLPLAAAGVARMVQERGRNLATAGAAVAGLGTIGIASIGLRHLLVYGLATQPEASALHVLDRIDDATGPIVLACMLAGPVALTLLVAAAARARLVPSWTIAAAVVYFVSDSFTLPGGEVIQSLVGLATFGFVARALLQRMAPGQAPSLAHAV